MAIYMLTVWTPYNSTEKMLKLNLKFAKMPSFIKKWLVFSTADGKKGIKVYNIIYVEKGKVDEAVLYITKVQQEYTEIDGYVYKLEPVLGMTDLQKLIALQI